MYSKQSLHYQGHRPVIPFNSEDMTYLFLTLHKQNIMNIFSYFEFEAKQKILEMKIERNTLFYGDDFDSST